MSKISNSLLRLQGAYYLVTGVWSLVHRRSFEAITGPKQDYWLVQTVGVLVTAIGVVLLAPRRVWQPAQRWLAAGSALGLAAIDLRHGLPGNISRIYALDGIAELLFAAGAIGRRRERS